MDGNNGSGSADLVTPLLGSQSCSPLVGVRTNRCPTCSGGGVVGDERTHRTCADCAGTGLWEPIEAHWHAPNALGADQFCAACDAEAR